jgi:3-hydroxy-9,10-secoandrosta-1,3,5(10)-triene-9,17-dione monooxygenase
VWGSNRAPDRLDLHAHRQGREGRGRLPLLRPLGLLQRVEHCEWIFLGGLLPKRDGSEGFEHTTFLLPKADYRVEHNWDVLGLRATGSHDIVVENAFVPEHRTQRTNDHSDAGCPGRAGNRAGCTASPSPRCSSGRCRPPAWARWMARSPSSAAAPRPTWASMAQDRRGRERPAGGERSHDDQRPAQAGAVPQLRRIVECARSGERMPVEERLMQRAQAAQVPKQCAAALSELMRACAASGTYKSNPIERIFRDIHQARGHIANNTDTYARIHGAVMLGLSNPDPFV